MRKKQLFYLLITSFLLIQNNFSYAQKNIKTPECRNDFIEYIRYHDSTFNKDNRKILTIIKFKNDNSNKEYYTNVAELRTPLSQAFYLGQRVKMYTTNCNGGDFGFAEFAVIK